MTVGVTGNYLNLSVHLFRVVGGLDTLDKMEKVKTDDKDRPLVRSSFVVTITWARYKHDVAAVAKRPCNALCRWKFSCHLKVTLDHSNLHFLSSVCVSSCLYSIVTGLHLVCFWDLLLGMLMKSGLRSFKVIENGIIFLDHVRLLISLPL